MTSRGHLVQPLTQTRASSRWILNISVDRDSITSLGQHLSMLDQLYDEKKLMFPLTGISCMPAYIHYVSSHLTDMWEESASISSLLSHQVVVGSSFIFSPEGWKDAVFLSCSSCCSPVPSWWLCVRLTGVCLHLVMETPSLDTYSRCGLRSAYHNHMDTRGLFQPQPFCDSC